MSWRDVVARLATTMDERYQAREALLGLLASQTVARVAIELAHVVARLDPMAMTGARPARRCSDCGRPDQGRYGHRS